MIFESFPWKQDLRRRKNLIIKYNTAEHFEKNDDTTYTVIEKAIFYSAFIIRKLIDCGGKLSDESENYSLKVCSVQPLKPVATSHYLYDRCTASSSSLICFWLFSVKAS